MNIEHTEHFKEATQLIIKEHQSLLEQVDFEQLKALVGPIQKAKRIFLLGAGRTGFMMRAFAMRLMHLGYQVYVVGETTTPAIGEGDLLLAGSGSGMTSGIVRAAQVARDKGAQVACFTTNDSSPLADLADCVVRIPAAQKQEQQSTASVQYAGSLFEQALLLLSDALVHVIWNSEGFTYDELWKRHANLE